VSPLDMPVTSIDEPSAGGRMRMRSSLIGMTLPRLRF
jgi:hypothetical protein